MGRGGASDSRTEAGTVFLGWRVVSGPVGSVGLVNVRGGVAAVMSVVGSGLLESWGWEDGVGEGVV